MNTFSLNRARTHGVQKILSARARRVRAVANAAEQRGDIIFAAACRGKAKAYDEAADLVRRLEDDARLPGRSREDRGRCAHDWIDRGEGQDEWRECFLCGRQEDR